jgi:hypothetical protein
MAKLLITERDLRDPRFADCEISDLERREDGAIVRRDRWERGIRSIAAMVGFTPRQEFEVIEVVDRVAQISTHHVATAHTMRALAEAAKNYAVCVTNRLRCLPANSAAIEHRYQAALERLGGASLDYTRSVGAPPFDVAPDATTAHAPGDGPERQD